MKSFELSKDAKQAVAAMLGVLTAAGALTACATGSASPAPTTPPWPQVQYKHCMTNGQWGNMSGNATGFDGQEIDRLTNDVRLSPTSEAMMHARVGGAICPMAVQPHTVIPTMHEADGSVVGPCEPRRDYYAHEVLTKPAKEVILICAVTSGP